MNDIEKKSLVKTAYNEIASEYSNEFKDYKLDNQFIDQFLGAFNEGNILDAGCGDGRDCRYINAKGFKVTGIDFSEQLLNLAKKENDNIEYINMDMTNLSFAEEIFEGIVSIYSLHHVPQNEMFKTLEGFNKVLKTKGRLLIIVRDGDGEKIVDDTFKPGLKNFVNYIKKDDLVKLLNNTKFNIISFIENSDNNNFAFGNTKFIVIAEKK